MFGSRLIALLLLAFSISGLTSAHDAQRSLADVDEIMMPSTDEYAYGERRLSWNFWSSMMFDVLGSWCAGPDGYCRLVCGPPPTYCQYYEGQSEEQSESNRGLGDTSTNADDDCDDKYEPDYGKCEICTARPKPKPPKKPSGKSSSNSSTTDDNHDDDCDDKVEDDSAKDSKANGNQKNGMKVSNLWMLAVAAAVVAMVAAGVILKKRRNVDEEEDIGSNGLWGAVNTRAAALLVGGGAAGAAGAAALPKFLSVPSMRRTPSGIEVDQNGGILEQSPSRYYEMEGADDESPHGVELSRNGSTSPYMV